MTYDHWPRSVRIAWCCTLPLGFALEIVVTMVVQFGLMIWMAVTLQERKTDV